MGFSELQKDLAAHLDRIARDRTELVVTRPGHVDMVTLPLAELTSLRETLPLLGSPANAARLAASMEQRRAGRGVEAGLIGT